MAMRTKRAKAAKAAETVPNSRDVPDGDGNVFGGESWADRVAEGHTPAPDSVAPVVEDEEKTWL